MDDYSEQTGQPEDENNAQRRRMFEFVLRSMQKPNIPPLQNGQSGSSRGSVLGNRQTDQGSPRGAMIDTSDESPLATPNTGNKPRGTGSTNSLGTGPEQPVYRDDSTRDRVVSPTRPTLPGSGETPQPQPNSRFAPSRPTIPAARFSDTDEAPNFQPPNGTAPRVLGMGNTQLLGRGAQPARPDVMPTREDFPAKPELGGWKKYLGLGLATLAGSPQLAEGILHGQRDRSERQYQQATQDWQRGQEGQERQARIEETQARTRSLFNPQPGLTPEETTLTDLMTGNNGGPQVNPETGQPYTRLEAYRTVQQAKQGAAQGAKQPPLDAATVSQINDMHTQRYRVLNPNKPLPPALTLRPGSTQQDYERVDRNLGQMESAQGTAAQREANNTFRRDAAANAAQSREERREEKFGLPVYAYDPDQKRTILTTQGVASQKNLQAIRKVSQPDIEKDTDKLRQIGDAQMNVSAYRMSLQGMNALSGNDLARVGALIGDDRFRLHFMGLEIPVDWYNQLRDNQKFNDLPEDAKDAVVGYIGARGSIIAYTKAISGTGRLTESQLQTEMQNLPKPTDPQDVSERKFARFQRNIDQAASGLPKIPGVDTPSEIRAKTEISRPPAQTPAQPTPAAPKGIRSKLVDFLNQKMGAQ